MPENELTPSERLKRLVKGIPNAPNRLHLEAARRLTAQVTPTSEKECLICETKQTGHDPDAFDYLGLFACGQCVKDGKADNLAMLATQLGHYNGEEFWT